jgi:hypothetical protein
MFPAPFLLKHVIGILSAFRNKHHLKVMHVFSAPDTLEKTDCPCIDAHSVLLCSLLGSVNKE